MKRFISIAIVTCLSAMPLTAEEETDGLSLMERGAQMLLEGLMQEVEPSMRDLMGMMDELEPALRDFAQEMGPAFAEILGQIGDISAYHAPEILPNGDIIIRRKTPLEPDVAPEGEIDI